MLLRTYRLTDKLGFAILKLIAAAASLTADGFAVILGGARHGSFSLLTVFLTLLLGLYRVLRRVALLVWSLLRVVLGVVGGVALLFINLGYRTSGRTAQSARSGASGTMARRAARAEMEAGLVEDPLRIQNRVLSGLVVVVLMAMIALVIWATGPGRTSPLPLADSDVNLLGSTPVETSAAAVQFATAVPTATEVPAVLQARGSVAFVVRERGQTDIMAVPVGGRNAIRLTNDPSDERDPSWSPDSVGGRQLVYAARRDGNWDLYIYDLDSGNTTRMTYGLEFEGAPHWSPDGKWLVYESYRGNDLDIYVVPIDGSQPPVRLPSNSDSADFSPAWSPTPGRYIAFASWRDGNQDIYVYSFDSSETFNLTGTPDRQEDHPAWSPDGKYVAYSAVDEGLEKVFVKAIEAPDSAAQVVALGRAPAWSPDGTALIFAVDSLEGTQLLAAPFTGEGVVAGVIPVPLGATSPTWTGAPLPPTLVNSGGLGPAVTDPLFVEQQSPTGSDPPYKLGDLLGVRTLAPYMSDRVNDSFNALRQATLEGSGVDFLGVLKDAWWEIDRLPQPGEDRRNWYKAGRQFGFNPDAIVGFPAPVEVVREDLGVNTWWRVYVRVADDAQSGQLGEPLRRMPWDFASRTSGDVEAYEQGGRLRAELPTGYYVDLTQLAADYGWERVPAGSDWRANIETANYWIFRRTDGLDWYQAMRELYTEGELVNFVPTPVAAPTQRTGG